MGIILLILLGSIPKSFGRLGNLELLDLSANELSGNSYVDSMICIWCDVREDSI